MRVAFIACFAAFLSGCASTASVSPALSRMGNVEIVPGTGGHQYVDRVSYRFDGASASGDALPVCVAQFVQNRSVTLRGSYSQTFVPFVGVVAQDPAREAGGGQVIRYISDDRRTVLASGALEYQPVVLMMPVRRSIRFNVTATAKDGSLSVVFDQIEQAQLETGVAPNDGYRRLGAWEGAGPEFAIGELKKIADKVSDCVKAP